MSEQLEQNPSDTVELQLKRVLITRDNSKLAVEVAEHEVPILELIHTEENVQVIDDGEDPGVIEVSANAEQELLRLRNKYDQKNELVVQAIYPRGARDLAAEGFAAGGKAERPVRAQVKTRAPAKKAAKKK